MNQRTKDKDSLIQYLNSLSEEELKEYGLRHLVENFLDRLQYRKYIQYKLEKEKN